MLTSNQTFHSRLLALLLLLGLAQAGQAATRALDRIETQLGATENRIQVYLNIPVRYRSHVTNDAGNEVDLQLQVIQTPEVALIDLVATDQLSWKPSAEIPIDKVVFRGALLGVSSLQISFASPVREFQVRPGKDPYRIELVLKKQTGLVDVQAEPAATTTPSLPLEDLPAAIHVINLRTQERPIDLSRIAPIPALNGYTLYTTRDMLEGQPRHRLRMGFFETQAAAERKLKSIKNFYPKAWIDRADVEEQRRALQLPADAPLPPVPDVTQKPALKEPDTSASKPEHKRLARHMDLARRTMTAGDYPKAIRMLEAILEAPANPYTREARELLGLARERNGQIAHAKAEYRLYLERYPQGQDAQRVRQRLLGLVTSTQRPREPLRPEQPPEQQVRWETHGSLTQNYRRDTIDSPFVDEDESVSRSEIASFLDLDSHRRGVDYDMRMRLATGYIHDLLDEDLGDGDEDYLSDAHIDVEHRDSRANLRLGRQRLRSSGIFNRFDGLVLGYELNPDVRLRLVGGLPVARTRDTFLNRHKRFAGINGDIANLFENWDLSLFFIEQRVDDLIDRRAIGGELRYFTPERSVFSLLDYDIHQASLNTFMLQTNWTLADQTRLYLNLDYRNTPVLLTSNALIGQTYPDSFLPILSIEELRELYTDDEIYQLTEDRTAKTRSVSLGASRSVNSTLQLSGDITVINTGSTEASAGVEALAGTGNEFYYTLQLIQNDLLKQGDIGIFSVNYADASTTDTLRLSASSRYPVNNFWRVNPQLSVSYRQHKDSDRSRLMISPFIRMDYRLRKDFTLEMEAGLNWYREDDGLETVDFTDYFFLAGYRWDF